MSILKDLDPGYAKIQASSTHKPHGKKLVLILFALALLGGTGLTWLVQRSTEEAAKKIQLASENTTQTIAEPPTSAGDTTSPPAVERSAQIRNEPTRSLTNETGADHVSSPVAEMSNGSNFVEQNSQATGPNAGSAAWNGHKRRISERKTNKKSGSRSQTDKREKKPEQRDIDIISAIVK